VVEEEEEEEEEEATSSYQFCPLAGRRLSAAVRDK
jgi:hypothetical protein